MKINKLIKSLSLSVISLGLLTGVGMSVGNNIHADHIAGELSKSVIEQGLKESDKEDAETEAGEIHTGIQMCRKYPQIAAYDAADDDDHIFQQNKNQILPYYNKTQMKEFIYDYNNCEGNGGTTIDSKGNIHKIQTTHHTKRVNKHSHVRKTRRTKSKKVLYKKRAIRRHRVKKVKESSYNYLGSSKQGKNQARRDYHNHKLLNESDKKIFNHLIRNKRFKSSKYLDGYVNKFIDLASADNNSDFADSYTHLVGYVQDYLRGNSTTKKAISDYYNHNKPNKKLIRHNHQYKEVYNNMTIA